MGIATQNRLETAACTKSTPFAGWGFVSKDLCYKQIITADTKILFRICYR
jgi:hypothetical protein